MLGELLQKNQRFITMMTKQAQLHFRESAPYAKFAVPAGMAVLWAAWPAAGDTIMGRNNPAEEETK